MVLRVDESEEKRQESVGEGGEQLPWCHLIRY
jgi:hypothetical protein